MLYKMAKQHDLVATCYEGVTKLFEFGLRGPQDLMLDWMADGEEATDAIVINHYEPMAMKNPLKNWRLQQVLQKNKGDMQSTTMQLFLLLVESHEHFVYGRLTLRPVVDAFRMLMQQEGKLKPFADGKTLEQQLHAVGLGSFAAGMMWVLKEVTLIDSKRLPCKAEEEKGRFVLEDIMTKQRTLKHQLRKLF